MSEFSPAYCIHCSTSTQVTGDTSAVIMMGVVYVSCRNCGKSIAYG